MSVISYRDNGRFPGLVQESAADEAADIKPGWSLRAEGKDADLGLKMIGICAKSLWENEEMMMKLEKLGWNEAMITALAAGERLVFKNTDPFQSLERLVGVVLATDNSLQRVIKMAGWRMDGIDMNGETG